MSLKVILIGPPGAGKSTVGRSLAKELCISFIDTDEEIEKQTGKKIPEIFLEMGEPGFREIERKVVLEALEAEQAVVALGGGSILDDEVFERLLREPQVVYLEVSISNAAPRVGFNVDRPLLIANPRAQWLKLFEQRRDKYEKLGKLRYLTDNRKAKDVAREIALDIS